MLVSCSEDVNRIKEMEKELNLVLPKDYSQIKNEEDGGLGSDYLIAIELKFNKNDTQELINQISNSPYFNQPTPNDYNSPLTKLLKDIHLRGLWKKSLVGYEFVHYERSNEHLEAILDTTKMILNYSFVNE